MEISIVEQKVVHSERGMIKTDQTMVYVEMKCVFAL